ncbi:Gfo/Idh/MocA family protein [Acidobacterium sp. S8]|uniref:Gfo/Idh/MocA family protein n=1 Tax=Acidobacterium sp. S8 TaxID=1641854 RepID=UPI00131C421A|nr:Gfo/Idh/MocA family oxidoreductase [Acidobacterium sp. S8]
MTDEMKDMLGDVSRRGFIRLGTMGAAGLGLSYSAKAENKSEPEKKDLKTTMIDVPFERVNPKIGIIGVGGRGTSLLHNLLAADAQIIAICDVVQEKAAHAQSLVEKAGQKTPTLYTSGDHAFESLVARDDLNLVIIATPWKWHVEMAVATMKHGKHAAVEVPAATTIDDCWKLVNTSEQTRRHCMMLENCCYGYNETLILRMVHAGMFGDLLYGEGAYIHDLREELFSNQGEGLWRRAIHTERDGNLYPTHGLGPVANYLSIQRGDRFDYIVSMSTPQRGLEAYRKAHVSQSDPKWAEHYVTGDMNTSLIKTSKGLTITVKHDVSNPHPYDRINTIAGTKGVFADYPPRIYFDGQPGGEAWGSIDPYKQYQHPLWREEGEIAQKLGGHGGMDYIMLYRLLQCMREGIAPDMDVYDAAAWSAPGPLSRLSVEQGSAPVKFPDFTRGNWQQRQASSIATQA